MSIFELFFIIYYGIIYVFLCNNFRNGIIIAKLRENILCSSNGLVLSDASLVISHKWTGDNFPLVRYNLARDSFTIQFFENYLSFIIT